MYCIYILLLLSCVLLSKAAKKTIEKSVSDQNKWHMQHMIKQKIKNVLVLVNIISMRGPYEMHENSYILKFVLPLCMWNNYKIQSVHSNKKKNELFNKIDI